MGKTTIYRFLFQYTNKEITTYLLERRTFHVTKIGHDRLDSYTDTDRSGMGRQSR